MRISPLGIFGTNYDLAQVSDWVQQDAALTHPHPACLQANALFAMAIADAIGTGKGASGFMGRVRCAQSIVHEADALAASVGTDLANCPESVRRDRSQPI